jgi:Protein of unknown function (DUF2577).
MFKERDNVPYLGPQVGTVVSASPLKVSLGDIIVLDANHLLVAAHVLNDYEREIEIPETSTLSGSTSTNESHNHSYQSLGMTGQIKFTDTLQAGDKVILVPAADEQRYFLIDKVVSL